MLLFLCICLLLSVHKAAWFSQCLVLEMGPSLATGTAGCWKQVQVLGPLCCWTRWICKKSMSQLAWDLKIAIKAPSSSPIPSFRCSPALLEFETVASNFLGLQRLTHAPWNSVPSVELRWWLNPWGTQQEKAQNLRRGFLNYWNTVLELCQSNKKSTNLTFFLSHCHGQ